jgi:hypothetical protein
MFVPVNPVLVPAYPPAFSDIPSEFAVQVTFVWAVPNPRYAVFTVPVSTDNAPRPKLIPFESPNFN